MEATHAPFGLLAVGLPSEHTCPEEKGKLPISQLSLFE